MAEIRLFPNQSTIFKDLFINKTAIHAVAICSRGFGKSHLGATAAIQACSELWRMPASVPNKQVVITAPTYDQVTSIYFDMLMYQLGLEAYTIKSSKDTGRIELPNNTLLRLMSAEAIGRLRGGGIYFAVNDETRDWTTGGGFKEAWESVIEPCITTRWGPMKAKEFNAVSQGRSLTITTPKGFDYTFEMFNRHERDDRYKSYHFDYRSSPMLDPKDIEKLMHTMDPVKFGREYAASFKESGNSVFYCFDRKIHVQPVEDYERNTEKDIIEDIHIAVDFNVNINASTACVIRGDTVYATEEFRGTADTEALCIAIKGRFWPTRDNEHMRKHCKIFIYPDPSGSAKKTSAIGKTDISIMQSHGFTVLAHRAHPSIVDSVQCVNRMLMTAAKTIHFYVSPKCPHLITSLERTKWVDNNADTATIDKKENIEHSSDGIRYFIEYKFPIYNGQKSTSRGFGF